MDLKHKVLLIWLLSIFSCSQDNEKRIIPLGHPYLNKAVFSYEVSIAKADSIYYQDTLHLHTLKKVWQLDLNQFEIAWEYPKHLNKSHTGLIAKKDSTWLHPPRSYQFKLLEANAFPFIKHTAKIGEEWNWSLTIGKHWFNEFPEILNHFEANNTTVQHVYKIDQIRPLEGLNNTKLSIHISAKSYSLLGNSQSSFVYHPDYGFTQLYFFTLDSSHFQFDLISINGKTLP